MNTFKTCTPRHLIHFCLFITLLLNLSSTTQCVDPFYELCAPETYCGQHLITYPFFINGRNHSCGFPGFVINCTNEFPVLRLSGNRYIIDQIFYNNHSVRVYNAALSDERPGCFPENIRDLSLVGDPKFGFFNQLPEVVLLANCSTNLSSDLVSRHRVECGGAWDLAMVPGDEELGDALEECRVTVAAPVEDDGVGGRAWELMRRGFMLNWTAANCSDCQLSGGLCGFDYASFRAMCFCTDGPQFRRCRLSTHPTKSLLIGIFATFGALLTLTTIVVFSLRRKIANKWKKKTDHDNNFKKFIKTHGSLAPKIYRYADIKKITISFKDKLGEGGYGSVYKGKLSNDTLVAVKIIKESKGDGEEFLNEVASISRTSHVNVVTLVGFCSEGRKRALIYEFMPNGSLDKFIYNGISSTNRQLGWAKSFEIAKGIARGLEYLHRGCNTRIVHFDIKPHNILLDEDFIPKISDFGLAKLCPGKESAVSMMNARGTIGYIAPEVYCRNFGRVSHKSDVYSYGMMILELVGERKNVQVKVSHGSTSEIYFPDWIYAKLKSDKELGMDGIMNEDENVYVRKMILVSLWCIQSDPSTRPSMSRVVEMLEGSLESLEIPPKPVLSSPQESPSHSSIIELR